MAVRLRRESRQPFATGVTACHELSDRTSTAEFPTTGEIVFGQFTMCAPGPDGVTVEHVLRDRTADLGIPVAIDAPFGHGSPNHAFPLGRRVTLRGDRLLF